MQLLNCTDLFAEIILQDLVNVEKKTCMNDSSYVLPLRATKGVKEDVISSTCNLAGVSGILLHFFSSDILICRVSSFCDFSSISNCGCIQRKIKDLFKF